jgi:NDP-sugar pyrophosphorylase family protein
MLLAAGRGTRMEPLSSLLAKPVLDVLGTPLLASALGHLEGCGCSPVVVNLHRHGEQVASGARSVAVRPAELRFSAEPELLGGAGGVAAARRLFTPGPLLVANADVWAGLDLAPLLADADDESVTLALLPHPAPERWTSVLLDADGRVSAFHPAGRRPPGAAFLYTGFQRIGATALAALPPPPAEWQPYWLALLSHGRLRGAVVSGSWREAGTPAAYLDLVLAELSGGCWTHPQAEVDTAATLERTAVGAGCTIAGGARLRDSVVTAGAAVTAGCRLERCIVAGSARLERDEILADLLVLPGGRAPLERP